MNVFLAAAGLSDVLEGIKIIIAHLVGGTIPGTTPVTITFAESWVGSFLGTITTDNGLFFIGAILSFTLFGIHVLKSLMGR